MRLRHNTGRFGLLAWRRAFVALAYLMDHQKVADKSGHIGEHDQPDNKDDNGEDDAGSDVNDHGSRHLCWLVPRTV